MDTPLQYRVIDPLDPAVLDLPAGPDHLLTAWGRQKEDGSGWEVTFRFEADAGRIIGRIATSPGDDVACYETARIWLREQVVAAGLRWLEARIRGGGDVVLGEFFVERRR